MQTHFLQHGTIAALALLTQTHLVLGHPSPGELKSISPSTHSIAKPECQPFLGPRMTEAHCKTALSKFITRYPRPAYLLTHDDAKRDLPYYIHTKAITKEADCWISWNIAKEVEVAITMEDLVRQTKRLIGECVEFADSNGGTHFWGAPNRLIATLVSPFDPAALGEESEGWNSTDVNAELGTRVSIVD